MSNRETRTVHATHPLRFGARRLIGQQNVRRQLERALQTDRVSHAWLFTGPPGSGKNAIALALAEYLNGISHFTDLGTDAVSRKSDWFNHPDIHFFLPLPRAVSESSEATRREMASRLTLLREDPYNLVDFKTRPVLNSEDTSKSLRAFYPIKYFRNVIREKCRLRPNEGRYTIVILTEIETMRDLVANTFLKLLEEPPENLIFLLTATQTDDILPTIWSRCRHVRLAPLQEEEIAEALVHHEGFRQEDALALARVCGGNYSLAKSLDLEALQETRKEITDFLRMVYTGDASALLPLIQEWQNKLGLEHQIALCNTLEMRLRDLMIWRESENDSLISDIGELEMIKSFCKSLPDARIPEMIHHLQSLKGALRQNVQFKLIFTALAFRFGSLMRGKDPVISAADNWQHLPAIHPEL